MIKEDREWTSFLKDSLRQKERRATCVYIYRQNEEPGTQDKLLLCYTRRLGSGLGRQAIENGQGDTALP